MFSRVFSSLGKTMILSILAAGPKIEKSYSQDELDVVTNKWLTYSQAPDFLYNHITEQAVSLLDRRAEEIAGLGSLSEWKHRQEKLHETLLDIVGPFPEKTPLNARITRTIEKDNFRVEHIIFESQPDFYVTASLFIPAGLKKNTKAPAIIYCSGHSADGYRNITYQQVILNLVIKGFIVLAFDPVGQGERLEYLNEKTSQSVFGDPTHEHSYPGTQMFITGSSLARYMIWDGIRAVDYLMTRKEVDAERIGITGRSGGGTQSAYIAAMDDRVFAAAPECYITNFTRLLQTIGCQDAEQNLFNGIARGIDHADLLSVRAPKPALMITTTRDYFSIQGARETEKEVALIYKYYGKESNFGRAEDDSGHASTQKNREALYAFFQHHLNNPGNSKDIKVEPLSASEMRVTATGQVSSSLGGETLFSLNRKEAATLIDKLRLSQSDSSSHLLKVINSAVRLSGYHEPADIDEPVFTGRFQHNGYVIEQYFVKGEGNYIIPYLLFVPEKPNSKALVYLHPSGKSCQASGDGEIIWFVRNGFTVLAPDLIGLGETGPGAFEGDAYINSVSHNIFYASMLIGRSIIGIRTGDVVRLVRLLQKKHAFREIYAVALKELSPVLLHAAAFEPAISRIALIHPCSSYQSIVMNRFYNSSFVHSTVPGAIKCYDLPDLAACLVPRRLTMAGITDGNNIPLNKSQIDNDMRTVKTTYQYSKAENQLNILLLEPDEKPFAVYADWIK